MFIWKSQYYQRIMYMCYLYTLQHFETHVNVLICYLDILHTVFDLHCLYKYHSHKVDI